MLHGARFQQWTQRFAALTACVVAFSSSPLQQDAFMMRPNMPTPLQLPTTSLIQLIPMPVSINATGETFTLAADASISVDPDSEALTSLGQYAADLLKPATGYAG